ncbi:MAG: tetratricopeptide repeat protein [Myxococcota bacterium]
MAVRIRRSAREALPLFQRAARAMSSIDAVDPRDRCDVLLNLGSTLRDLGDLAAAKVVVEDALALAAAHPATRAMRGILLQVLSRMAMREGRADDARALGAAALAAEEEAGDLRNVVNSLMQLGNIEFTMGDSAAARRFYARARPIAARVGVRDTEARLVGNLALCARRDGDLAEAEALLLEAMPLFERVGEPRVLLQARGALGMVQLDLGRPHDAAVALQHAVDGLVALDEPLPVVDLAPSLVRALVGAGDPAGALAAARDAEARARSMGSQVALIEILAARGLAEAASGGAAAATLAEASALLDAVGAADDTAASRAVAALRDTVRRAGPEGP